MESPTQDFTSSIVNENSSSQTISFIEYISKKSPSNYSSYKNSIRDNFTVIQMEGKSFLRCLKCPARFSVNTSSTNLKKHINSCHSEHTEDKKTIVEDKELFLLSYIIECNLSLNTLRKDSFKKLIEFMGIKMTEERLLKIISTEANKIRRRTLRNLDSNVPCSIQIDGWTNINGEHLYATFYKTWGCESTYMGQDKGESHVIQGAKWLSQRLKEKIDTLKSTGRVCYCVTSDNAQVIKSAVREVNNIISPKVLHHMCSCHCINLLLGKVIEKFSILKHIQELKEKVEKHKRDIGYIKIKSYTQTRWYSLKKHLHCLFTNADTFNVEHSQVLSTFNELLEYFDELLHKLEGNNTNLIDAYDALVNFEKNLRNDKSSMSDFTQELYLKDYFPNYIDSSCCISMMAFLTPKWKKHIMNDYGNINGVIMEIHEKSAMWNIPISVTILEKYQMGLDPFVFNELSDNNPIEQWESLSLYTKSNEVKNLCYFYRILSSISPTETIVERGFSIEKFIHSSVRSRLSYERVEDLMTLKLNYILWKKENKL